MRSRRVTAITFTLSFDEGLSIAEPLRARLSDRMAQAGQTTIPVAQDADGEPIVMGTAVAGPLRAHLRRYVLQPDIPLWFKTISAWNESGKKPTWESRHATLADLLFGSEPEEIRPAKLPPAGDNTPTAAEPPRALRPSALRVVSVSTTARRQDVVTAARTAINRRSGVGETGKLFQRDHVDQTDVEVVLAIDLSILDGALQDLWSDPAVAGPASGELCDDLLAALQAWTPQIGGMAGVGFGEAMIKDIKHGTRDPLSLDDLFAAPSTVGLYRKLADALAVKTSLSVSAVAVAADRWSLEVPFTAADPLLVSPRRDQHVGNLDKSSDTVLGSSWRGLLRSRCEFILRSVGVRACESTHTKKPTCGTCPTCELFGWAAEAATAGSGESGRAGLIKVRRSRISAGGAGMETIPHVAIDRFTGGAANEKLYSHTAYAPGATVKLRIEQQHPTRPVPKWGRHLLVLAIRDLNDGVIGLGNSTTRGYGTLVTSQLPDLPEDGWVDSLRAEYAQEGAQA